MNDAQLLCSCCAEAFVVLSVCPLRLWEYVEQFYILHVATVRFNWLPVCPQQAHAWHGVMRLGLGGDGFLCGIRYIQCW